MEKKGQATKYIQLTAMLERILAHAGVPKSDVVLGGSALLGALGLREINDLDVQVPEEAFKKMSSFPGAVPGRSPIGSPMLTIRTNYGPITVFTGRWYVGGRDFSNVPTTTLRGLKHWDVPTTLDFKRRMGREKDTKDIERMKKQGSEEEVARVFRGQKFSDKDIALGPRNEGWETLKSEFKPTPSGVMIEKTTRVRRFGRMKKTAFLQGFEDELEKKGFTLIELMMLLGLGAGGGGAVGGLPGAALAPAGMIGGGLAGSAVGDALARRGMSGASGIAPGIGALGGTIGGALLGRKIQQWLQGRRRTGQEKKASYLDKFAAGAKMLLDPNVKKSPVLRKNPFLRLETGRKLVSGKKRTTDVPKAKGLLSGSIQFAHLTRRSKEAS